MDSYHEIVATFYFTEAASVARGLQPFAHITVANSDELTPCTKMTNLFF